MNPAPRLALSVSGVWQRRLAKTPLRRRIAAAASERSLSTTAPVLRQHPKARRSDPYAPTALSAFLARLALPACPNLHPALLAALTHPSFARAQQAAAAAEAAEAEKGAEVAAAPAPETNELLAVLGNSLLGLFGSEYLAQKYPHLPTGGIKNALTAYVGPEALVSVGRELGLAVVNDAGNTHSRANAVVGIPIRWSRAEREEGENAVETPVAPGYRSKQVWRKKQADTWPEAVASVVRALVGLIYQEQGIHAAREFVHAHFLSRHVDMSTVMNIRHPKHVLSTVVSKHLINAGAPASATLGHIDSRVLASSGVNSQAPLFNIGLFLPNGLKLAEGHGSSIKMAEHRAATNALHSLFLARSDAASSPAALPTTAHSERPVAAGSVETTASDKAFAGSAWGGDDSVFGLGRGLKAARQ
ncbi:54S ribosomal protein L3 mitochondrial [Vanrija albida]|uniref:Large ribosomal subunit protein mL44 n=1 Tax=Vanrija albida TaxID=181172 RepID=A0ABR3PZ76_9TREE